MTQPRECGEERTASDETGMEQTLGLETARVDAPASPGAPPPGPALVIEPAPAWPKIDFAELWAYRSLMSFLVFRDVKVRYSQTVFGAAWAIVQPVLTMVVFTIVFGRFAKVPSDGAPYSLFAL